VVDVVARGLDGLAKRAFLVNERLRRAHLEPFCEQRGGVRPHSWDMARTLICQALDKGFAGDGEP